MTRRRYFLCMLLLPLLLLFAGQLSAVGGAVLDGALGGGYIHPQAPTVTHQILTATHQTPTSTHSTHSLPPAPHSAQHQQRDRLYDQRDRDQQQAQPQVSAPADAVRIAAERTVRVLPSQGGNSRGQGMRGALCRYYPSLSCFCHMALHLSASPRRGCASCLYYVIALRHIIR